MEGSHVNLKKYPLDIVIVITSLIVFISTGLHYAYREHIMTLSQMVYGRKISLFIITGSLVTTFYNTRHIVDIATRSYVSGLKSLYYLIAHIGIIYFAIYVFSPVFYKTKVVTIYEYLEKRFGKATRKFGSVHFILCLITHASYSMHALARMISRICGVSHFFSVTATIAICVFYLIMGGVQAVMWTNTLQGIVMIIAILTISFEGIYDVGGYSYVWKAVVEGSATDNMRFGLSLTENTFWSAVISEMIFLCYLHGISQVHIQMAFCSKSPTKYRLSLLLAEILDAVFYVLIVIFGIVMYASLGNCDSTPNASNVKPYKEQLIPLFVKKHGVERSGLYGLAIIGIACASLTSVASIIHSASYTTLQDLVLPLFAKERLSDERLLLMMKLLVQFYGGITIFFTFSIASIRGFNNIIYAILQGYFTTQTGMFTLGMLFRTPNQKGIIAAVILENAFIFFIAMGKLTVDTTVVPALYCPETGIAQEHIFYTDYEEFNSTRIDDAKTLHVQLFTQKFQNEKASYHNNTKDKNQYGFSVFLLNSDCITIISYFLFIAVGYFISWATGTKQDIPSDLLSTMRIFPKKRTSLKRGKSVLIRAHSSSETSRRSRKSKAKKPVKRKSSSRTLSNKSSGKKLSKNRRQENRVQRNHHNVNKFQRKQHSQSSAGTSSSSRRAARKVPAKRKETT